MATLTACGFCVATQAAETGEQWWKLSDPAAGAGVGSVDAKSIQCAKGVCSIGQRTAYAAARPDGATWRKDLIDYDCVGFRMAARSTSYFDAKGRLIKQDNAPAQAWREVERHSAPEAILTFACRASSMAPADFDADVVRFDQYEFVRDDNGSPPPPAADKPPLKLRAEQSAADPVRTPQPGAVTVQVAATASAQEARQAIAKLDPLRTGPAGALQANVVQATVSGRRVYRALLGGFADRTSAAQFCAGVKAAGGACFVRNDSRG